MDLRVMYAPTCCVAHARVSLCVLSRAQCARALGSGLWALGSGALGCVLWGSGALGSGALGHLRPRRKMEEEARQALAAGDPDDVDGQEDPEEEALAEELFGAEGGDGALGTSAPEGLVAAAGSAHAEAVRRNSVSHRAEWARFKRIMNSKACPTALADKSSHKLSESDLFSVWLDSEEDIDKVALVVERSVRTQNSASDEHDYLKKRQLLELLPSDKVSTRRDVCVPAPSQGAPCSAL